MTIRQLGRECIQKRINAIESGEQVPNDILTHIVKITSGLLPVHMSNMKVIFTMALFQTIFLATTGDIDVEDLVDDFTTFYVAGK